MTLIIDSGNTFLKLGVYDQTLNLNFYRITYDEIEITLEKIIKNYRIENIVLSVVGHLDVTILEQKMPFAEITTISNQSIFPFKNTYETPETLGIDRMVLSAGAVFKYPNKNRLVIDIGSCITYDYINNQNDYLGGAISPGINMRYAALHEKTAKLPLLKAITTEYIIGKNTNQSIHSGVINGILFEINGFVNHLTNQNDNFIIILTGGGSIFFDKPLKSIIFVEPNFLMDSLAQLFIYQTNQ